MISLLKKTKTLALVKCNDIFFLNKTSLYTIAFLSNYYSFREPLLNRKPSVYISLISIPRTSDAFFISTYHK